MDNKSLYITSFFLSILIQLHAQNGKQRIQIMSKYNSTRLKSFEQTFYQKSKNEKQLARQRGWKNSITTPDGSVMELQGVVDGKPIYYTTLNVNGGRSTRTDHLHNTPKGVTGIGDRIFWDNQLTCVTIPDRVTSTGGYAFRNNRLISVML